MKRFHLSNVFLNQAARDEREALNVIRDLHPWRATNCRKCGKPTRLDAKAHVASCAACGATASEWAGTILEESHASLAGVLTALRAMGEANPGLRELESRTGLAYSTLDGLRDKTRSYCGAWLDDQVLDGEVEVDEVLLRGKKLSGRANPAIIVLASRDGKTAVAVPVPDQGAATLEAVIQKHVAPGARILTDAWRGYNGLTALGYDHVARKQAKLPMAHAAAKSLRDWLRADNRKELNTSGKAAHWSLVYSHRHLKSTRADALLDACLPTRPRGATALTHVVRVPLRLSRVERDAVWKRLHGQELFSRLLCKRAHAKLHDTVTSRAWRSAPPLGRRKQWDALGFTQSWLETEATQILQSNSDVADYVDRMTANELTKECYENHRKWAWKLEKRRRKTRLNKLLGARRSVAVSAPRPSRGARAWNGANQRQGLALR